MALKSKQVLDALDADVPAALDRIAPFLPPGCATREVYPASEVFVAVADRGEGEGLRLCLDRGCFFEFVPVGELDAPAPRRHWAATIETGVDYAVAVTSCAGLWSYILGDTFMQELVVVFDAAPDRMQLKIAERVDAF